MMMSRVQRLVVLLLGYVCCGHEVSGSKAVRQVVQVLSVENGHDWGDWQEKEFCPKGTYASAFQLKVDPAQSLRGDDTGVNGLALYCTKPHTLEDYGRVTSQPGPWGRWHAVMECGVVAAMQFFITAFQLRSEPSRGTFGDDTAVNNIRFRCRQLISNHRTFNMSDRGAPWGMWGAWSSGCPLGSAICGLQTKLVLPQGGADDTALTDVRLFCCNDGKP